MSEILITVGLVSAELMAYIAIVKRFPIVAGAAKTVSATRGNGHADKLTEKIQTDLRKPVATVSGVQTVLK